MFEAVGERETFSRLEKSFGYFAFLEPSDACGIVETLSDRQLIIKSEKVGKITEASLASVRVIGGLDAFDLDAARKRLNKGSDTTHQCGFSRTVGADERNNASFLDRKTHAKEYAACGVFEDQIFNGDQRTNLPCCGLTALSSVLQKQRWGLDRFFGGGHFVGRSLAGGKVRSVVGGASRGVRGVS